MSCVRIGGAIVDVGGPMLKIRVNGKAVHFENHSYCGPQPCRVDGKVRSIGPRHPFWKAVTRWYQSGKRVDRNGWCVVEEPSP